MTNTDLLFALEMVVGMVLAAGMADLAWCVWHHDDN